MNRQMNQMSGRHGPGFTPKQDQYLAFIDAYTRVNRTARRMGDATSLRRHPAIRHQMILALERAGFIRRQPGVPRSIEVLVPLEDLPVLQAHIQPVRTSVSRY